MRARTPVPKTAWRSYVLWREFLTHEDPKEQPIRRADWVVGDESFQKRLQGHHGRAVQRRRGRPPKSGGQEAGISS